MSESEIQRIYCAYAIPSHWDIGKVYKRLIKQVSNEFELPVTETLIKVYMTLT